MYDTDKFWRGVGYVLLDSIASAVPVIVLVSGVGEFFW